MFNFAHSGAVTFWSFTRFPPDLCGIIRVMTIVRYRAKLQASNLPVTLHAKLPREITKNVGCLAFIRLPVPEQ
jgi:hypothetical protein